MKNIGRVTTLFLLLGLLYAIYCYQKRIAENERDTDEDEKTLQDKFNEVPIIREVTPKPATPKKSATDTPSIDNISQLSLDTLDDIRISKEIDVYNRDGSIESNGDTLSFLDSKSQDSNSNSDSSSFSL